MDCDNAINRARVLRAAARLHRLVAECVYSPSRHWFDLLCAQLEREEQDSIARDLEAQAAALDAAVQEYEWRRVELVLRGAVLGAAA